MTAERRPIAGFPDYAVDAEGIVWSFKSGEARPLRPLSDSNGYTHVNLYRHGRVRLAVHRLVLEAFVGPCPDGLTARHRDGVRTNNELPNLAWGTWAEQIADRRRHGTETPTGERNLAARMTDAQVREMRTRRAPGLNMRRRGSTGPTYASLAAEFGCSEETAAKIINGRIRTAP